METIESPKLLNLETLSENERRDKLIAWRRDPVLYCIERLGIKCSLGEDYQTGDQLDVHEKKMLRALPIAIILRKAVIVTSANSMGKDYTISGRGTLWFFECFGPTCKVVETGPTERQVIDIMWNELTGAYHARPSDDEMGRLLVCKLDDGPHHFITAFTTKETGDKQGKFQGIHSPRLMVVMSEAQAIDDIIFDQVEGLSMADVFLLVVLGNPLTNSGRFATMIEDPKNMVIRLDAYDSINVKTGKQMIPGLVNKAWVDDKEIRWNADKSGKDPRYMARVRGMLPTTSINAIISRDLYRACIDRVLTWWSAEYITIGVDPALTGTDDMVISIFKSGQLVDEWVIPYNENEVVAAGKIAIKLNEHAPNGGATIVIDCDGLGFKVAQAFAKMLPVGKNQPNQIVEYRGSCSDREVVDPQYVNTRAEAHFYAKQRMMDGHISLDDNDYAKQEATETLYFTKKGRIQIEDKDDLKGRIMRSPNRWDARVLAIWGFKSAIKITKKDAWASDGARSDSSMLPPGGSAMAA